jgi:hypothetical protein
MPIYQAPRFATLALSRVLQLKERVPLLSIYETEYQSSTCIIQHLIASAKLLYPKECCYDKFINCLDPLTARGSPFRPLHEIINEIDIISKGNCNIMQ